MKLNKIGEVWNSANRLLSDFFGLLSSKNFATMETWRNDFSSLFWTRLDFDNTAFVDRLFSRHSFNWLSFTREAPIKVKFFLCQFVKFSALEIGPRLRTYLQKISCKISHEYFFAFANLSGDYIYYILKNQNWLIMAQCFSLWLLHWVGRIHHAVTIIMNSKIEPKLT